MTGSLCESAILRSAAVFLCSGRGWSSRSVWSRCFSPWGMTPTTTSRFLAPTAGHGGRPARHPAIAGYAAPAILTPLAIRLLSLDPGEEGRGGGVDLGPRSPGVRPDFAVGHVHW